MSRRPLRTLIAAPPAVAQTLAKALGELSAEVLGVATPEEAGPYLDRELDLILVCYVFDDLHPYKFINRIRNESPHKRTPVVLIRALPVPLGESQEWEIRRAYKSIGVSEFVNYSEMVHAKGSAHADAALRECISKLISS